MFSSATMIRESEALSFDPSVLDFDYDYRDVDHFSTYRVSKSEVSVFAHNNGCTPDEMFNRLVDSAHGDTELYNKFINFCLEVN